MSAHIFFLLGQLPSNGSIMCAYSSQFRLFFTYRTVFNRDRLAKETDGGEA